MEALRLVEPLESVPGNKQYKAVEIKFLDGVQTCAKTKQIYFSLIVIETL